MAAGRISAQDKAQRRLDAAVVWREVARRSGDARRAAQGRRRRGDRLRWAAFDPVRRPDAWARARCEQGFSGLLGAELFGDPGLDAAAVATFREARSIARGGLAAPLADVGIALVEARDSNWARATPPAARAAAARFNAPDRGA